MPDSGRRLLASDQDFTLTLRWTCQTCGWTVVLDAPGFAGDGRYHYIDGQRQCGPITAQKDWSS